MEEKLITIIMDVVASLNEDLCNPSLDNISRDTALYGKDGNLDSLSLVNLIADIEYKVEENLNVQIVLADERAMSRRRSPFRTIQSLAGYIKDLMKEENHG
jgi:acyl carrier protein